MAQVGAHPIVRKRRLRPTAKIGASVLLVMMLLCLLTLPWTRAYYDFHILKIHHAPPQWGIPPETDSIKAGEPKAVDVSTLAREPKPYHTLLGTDDLGRSLLARCLLGGAISLGIGLASAGIAVTIGTLWGMISGYAGGRVDAVMMRIVDVLYGLPYILLVLLLVVAVEGAVDNLDSSYANRVKQATAEGVAVEDLEPHLQTLRKKLDAYNDVIARVTAATERLAAAETDEQKFKAQREADALQAQAAAMDPRPATLRWVKRNMTAVNLLALLVAIGSVSWLTLARVVRGQVLSLKAQPFVEAARALGCGNTRILMMHLLPNLLGPIIVYTTLTVPQAILQESFLSFLGIGVKPPLPSWGNLAAEGLKELNTVESYGWLLAWPCLLLGVTLLSLNFVGDGLRDKYDPRTQKE